MVNSIKLQLLVRGVKQIDIARKAGVSKAFICNIIAGREKPTPKVKQAFKYFGIELEEE